MILKLNEKSYDISTGLGVSYDIETKHKSKINKILEKAGEYTIKDMCELMFFGIVRKDKTAKFEDFFGEVLDSELSVIDLQKEFTVFIRMLTSTDKTEDEVREELDKAYTEGLKETEQKVVNNEKN